MVDLSTKYMGLSLKSPIIVGSSGLTNNVDSIKEHAANGAGAVILKSLFEEQIRMESEKGIRQADAHNYYAEAQDYISNYTKEHRLDEYLNLIENSKKAVDIRRKLPYTENVASSRSERRRITAMTLPRVCRTAHSSRQRASQAKPLTKS